MSDIAGKSSRCTRPPAGVARPETLLTVNSIPYAEIIEVPDATENFEFARIAKQGTRFRVTREGSFDVAVRMAF